MAIKKAFVEIIEFLESNSKKQVSTILGDVKSMCEAKRNRGSNSYLLNDKKQPVAIKCGYFGNWMPLVGDEAVEFGIKASSPTGLNTMCKEGASQWAKQNRERIKAEAGMVQLLKSKELALDGIEAYEAKIQADFEKVIDTDLGFEDKDDLLEYLEAEGVKLAV